MTRINDDFLNCSIYLYKSESDAADGISAGGSGFLVSVPSEVTNCFYVYAVTNRHVIRIAKAPIIRLNLQNGRTQTVHLTENDWVDHPDLDDLSVVAIRLDPNKQKVKAIPISMFLTNHIIKEHNIGCGDEVFMVGRFCTHEGRQKNTPSVRFGNISMFPCEPILREDGILQDSILVEMRSLGGYSGSPVLLNIPPLVHRPGTTVLKLSYHTFLLGVDWGHLYTKNVINTEIKDYKDKFYQKVNTGKSAVVPAWKLLELLNSEELATLRRDEDSRLLKQYK